MQNNHTMPFVSSYHSHPEAIFQRVGEDLIIINLNNDRIYSLNKTAGRFWELLMTGMTITDIKKQLEIEFEVESESLEKEIYTILQNLLQEGLILANSNK